LPSSPTAGLSNLTGPYVTYEEYTHPRTLPTGFNPSDKVVTRVARLYYYRDAHRVVQLINRGARSYNRQAVDMQQQLADNARRDAENATGERRAAEQKAIQAAQRSRASETALTQFQQALVTARQQQATAEANLRQHQTTHETLKDAQEDATAARIDLEATDPSMMSAADKKALAAQVKEAKRLETAAARKVEASDQTGTQKQSAVTAAQSEVTNAERHVNALLADIQNARNEEAQQRETLDKRQFEEDSKHKDLFRREVAAAHEDPDTFAPGVPTSQDPIEQVSLSVIGEGLIQLRGPLKGVNLARTLINQIDAPVGQVKVAIHTVQVNGEHGKRMEPVIGRIQRYIDHSRFLTTQSGQMLRNAVTLVASRRADQAMALCEGASQTERDQKYIEAFFGREFLAELRTLDSEFLHTGNKLLSLHSMDSTSLANALFLLSLAKNDVRQEILGEFERMVTCNLPQDEMEYFTASNEKYKFGPMFHKQKFVFLGHNAKFVSLKGFFNADVAGSDTMTPMQREFIRLAQIFKSRLVTEIELGQRVMERSLIEERIGNYANELENAKRSEDEAERKLRDAMDVFDTELDRVSQKLGRVNDMLSDTALDVKTIQKQLASTQIALEGVMRNMVGAINMNLDKKNQLPIENPRQIEQFVRFLLPPESDEELIKRSGTDLKLSARILLIGKENKQVTKYLATDAGAKYQSLQSRTEIVAAMNKLATLQSTAGPPPGVSEKVSRMWSGRSYPTPEQIEAANKQLPRDEWEKFAKHLSDGIKISVPGQTVVIRPTEWKPDDPQWPNWDCDEGWSKLEQGVATLREAGEKHRDKLTQFQQQVEFQAKLDLASMYFNRVVASGPTNEALRDLSRLMFAYKELLSVSEHVGETADRYRAKLQTLQATIPTVQRNPEKISDLAKIWSELQFSLLRQLKPDTELFNKAEKVAIELTQEMQAMVDQTSKLQIARREAELNRRPLDHKKYMDMLIDDVEDKFIELMEGTRAHTANIDNYLSRLGQALEDDFNTQFYFPAFKGIREASRYWDVNMGQIETTTILTNNRMLAKVSPQATMEFDLPKRDILIDEAFKSAQAAYDDYGALLGDPTFLSLTKMHRGQPPSALFGGDGSTPSTRNVLPGLPSSTDEKLVAQNRAVSPDFPSALESLIPDPAIYKFETGTGYEIRPVIQPDGQAVVFHFNYMYTTNIREPVRADEKHLGRVKRHFIDTDVQTGNYEMREVSKYQVALKASRTSRGVPLLEDIPGAGVLFRPQPSQESSIQENIILAQSVIFPTLFDLMGLRWAPAVADLDSLRLIEADFVTRSRQRGLRERVFDHSSQQVDEFLRIPESERRPDLYRSQETTPYVHPNGYSGPGLNLKDGILREGYDAEFHRPESRFVPGASPEGTVPPRQMRGEGVLQEGPMLPLHEEAIDAPKFDPPVGPSVPPSPAPAAMKSHTVPSSRTSKVTGNSPVQLQSFRTESPSAPKVAPPASSPRVSRPVPKQAGSPPGLLPDVSPPPQRLPTNTGSQKPIAGGDNRSAQSRFSPATRQPQVQPGKDIKQTSATRSSQIVQASATESAKLEPAQPAAPVKKKFGAATLWPRKP